MTCLKWVFDHSPTTGAPRQVLSVLAFYANNEGKAWPGSPRIAHDAKVSRSTAFRALRELEGEGAIARTGDHRHGRVVWLVVMNVVAAGQQDGLFDTGQRRGRATGRRGVNRDTPQGSDLATGGSDPGTPIVSPLTPRSEPLENHWGTNSSFDVGVGAGDADTRANGGEVDPRTGVVLVRSGHAAAAAAGRQFFATDGLSPKAQARLKRANSRLAQAEQLEAQERAAESGALVNHDVAGVLLAGRT